MTDREAEIQLAEIKKRRAAVEGIHDDHTTWWWLGTHDVPWLIGQVEQDQQEIERLRGLLRRLEWRGVRDLIDEERCCPVCAGRPTPGPDGEAPGHGTCWLAAEIGQT